MFSFFPKWLSFEYSLILEEEEWLTIADTEWTESIDDIYILQSEVFSRIEYTLDIHHTLGEVVDIMHRCELGNESLLELWYFGLFDGESCRLSMSSISHEEVASIIEELYHITPIRRTTRGNRECLWMFDNLRGY